jgi:hypothetical protein
LPKGGLRYGRHLGIRGVQTGTGLQVNPDNGLTTYRGRFDVFDVVNCGGQYPFIRTREPTFQFFGIHAGKLPGHGDHWDVDVRENIGGRAQDHDRAQNQNEHGQNDEGIRSVQSDSNNPHN